MAMTSRRHPAGRRRSRSAQADQPAARRRRAIACAPPTAARRRWRRSRSRGPASVITDLRMPGIDGLQLFEAIHRQHPALPVIILTAHGTIPDAVARDAARRVRLPDQAVRQPGAAAEGRRGAAAVGRRAGRAADTARRMARGHHHAQPADGGPAAPGAARRRFRRERADLRRFRHRQGAARARDPPREPARATSRSSR